LEEVKFPLAMWNWLILWNPLAMLWEAFTVNQPFADPERVRLLGMIIGSAAWLIASRIMAEFINRKRGPMTLWWILFFIFNLYAIVLYWILEEHASVVQRNSSAGRKLTRHRHTVRDIVGTAIIALEPSERDEPELCALVRANEFDKALNLLERKYKIALDLGDIEAQARYRGLMEWVKNERESDEFDRKMKSFPF